ncbi:MAG: type 1 glutamine amidotransferase, partial [Magnetococcales bacterium]|nr:type 1 glutamine amidotransferase [Magnetococcales bacterium]
MKRVAIIVAQNFQDEEFVYPYYRCLEEGYKTEVATPTGEMLVGKYGVPARATMATKDLDAKDFDAVILPGGFESPDRLRLRKEVLKFVREMDEQGKLVAAICHGPWVVISAGTIKGRKATAYMSIADDMKNAGADYKEENLVIDGNLITAPHYNDNGPFMRAVV